MYCMDCGEEVSNNSKFCQYCGINLQNGNNKNNDFLNIIDTLKNNIEIDDNSFRQAGLMFDSNSLNIRIEDEEYLKIMCELKNLCIRQKRYVEIRFNIYSPTGKMLETFYTNFSDNDFNSPKLTIVNESTNLNNISDAKKLTIFASMPYED